MRHITANETDDPFRINHQQETAMHYFRALRHTSYFLLLLGLFVFGSPMAHADKKGMVIQVSDNNPATWNQALNVAENVPQILGKDNVEVEIVAFGHGLNMLKFDSEVGNRLKKAADSGVALWACGVTMGKMKLTEKDLYPVGIKVIPAGVVEIMQKSQAGWFHIRP